MGITGTQFNKRRVGMQNEVKLPGFSREERCYLLFVPFRRKEPLNDMSNSGGTLKRSPVGTFLYSTK